MQIVRKRPRKLRAFRTRLSMMNYGGPCGCCDDCLDRFQEIVDRERPDHYWRVEDGVLHYKEDDAYEAHLGRKLKPTESVIVKNGDFKDCRIENLELIDLEGLDKA